jgi:tellurite resistance protein TerC
MLIIDLKVFHRENHKITIKESLAWTFFWIVLALIFNAGLYFWRGEEKALEFLTGYLIEKSLSVDNLFVFLLIFSYFKVEDKNQHNTLFWGILGALVMRVIFIFAGVALIEKFHWIIYIFGAFLVFIGFKMAFEKEKEIHPEKNPVINFIKKIIPVTNEYSDGKFFIKQSGKWAATPLFIVLIAIETTDIIFAVDSIPAILAISTDPFIVYTSNVFAILGLRALYFALAGVINLFKYLNYGLAAVLVFVGVKMLISKFVHIPVQYALGVVAGVIAISILASIIFSKKEV